MALTLKNYAVTRIMTMRRSRFVITIDYGYARPRYYNGMGFKTIFTSNKLKVAKRYKTMGEAYRKMLKFPQYLSDKLYIKEIWL